MKKYKHFLYLVEGECERKMVSILKSDMQSIRGGKVEICNVFYRPLSRAFLRTIESDCCVVLIFDTDLADPNYDLFNRYLQLLSNSSQVREVVLIPQVHNFEEELVFSTDIKRIHDLLPSKGAQQFKNDFCSKRNDQLVKKLNEHQFSLDKMWSHQAEDKYVQLENSAYKIKLTDRNKR